jgi:SAM-dependent methyltransferase
MQIYLRDKYALAFYHQKASSDFWDRHWQIADLQAYIRSITDDGLFVPAVKRYLLAGSTVLEGGCGRGQLVHALQYQGYKAIGVDYASETIKNIKDTVLELDVRLGDVRALDLSDGSLDGYVSVGVIEHFWEGYHPIISEMHRTLRVGGFLFVSFPYMSPLRRLKVSLHLYPFKDSNLLNNQQEQFYQFAFTASKVQADLKALGFELKEKLTYDGIKGFKDEVSLFKPWLQKIYDSKRGIRLRHRLDWLFKSFASHCALLVMQKVR